MEYENSVNGILYSASKKLLQVEVIHRYLSVESYWAKGIPFETVKASIKGSLCFAAYQNNKLIAFARVITDGATFGYLADVFVLEEFRGRGISKELMRFIMDCQACKGFRRMMLATWDAHGLYAQFGFTTLGRPDRFMEIKFFQNYTEK
jgi:GNAT superfamily N-acetyltransferase